MQPTFHKKHCAELKHGVFHARDVFRCQHFKKWFPILQEDNYHEFRALGFEHWDYFTNHHTDCDNGATTRALIKTRVFCDSDEPCKHIGYHNSYPWLSKPLSSRRRCFRVLPSLSRFDITDEIESEIRLSQDVANWPPLMLIMFSTRGECRENPRKIKRRNHQEVSVPLKWDKEMKKTLDRVELLELAFNDNPKDMELICDDFGHLSIEAITLREIRDLVAPTRSKPNTTLDFGTMHSENSEPTEMSNFSPTSYFTFSGQPFSNSASSDVEATQKPEDAIEPQNEGECVAEVSMPNSLEKQASVPSTGTAEEEFSFVSNDLEGDELLDEDLLPPPAKRRRDTGHTVSFPYTRKPNHWELNAWQNRWRYFYKAQVVLKRGPAAAPHVSTDVPDLISQRRKGGHKHNAEDEVSSAYVTDDEDASTETTQNKHQTEQGEHFRRDFTFRISKGALKTPQSLTD